MTAVGRIERFMRFCATHRVINIIAWGKRCPECGVKLIKMHLSDLPADIQNKHIKAGTDLFIDMYAYRCPVDNQEYMVA
jgi:uncharacterized protein with PIN domain